MGVDRKEVEHIARLANLALNPDELTATHLELEKILNFVAELSRASEEALQTSQPGPSSTPERPDKAEDSLPTDRFIPQAPAAVGTAFQVPRIIEQEH